jgi:hypothetical protein
LNTREAWHEVENDNLPDNALLTVCDCRIKVAEGINVKQLLEEVLAYLERRDVGGSINCRRDEQGNLLGPETRRFLIAEKVREALKGEAMKKLDELFNYPDK